MAINPRYVCYAHAHGRTAEDQLAHDKEAYQGGCMCGFILWMSEQKRAFFAAHPEAFCTGWNRRYDPHAIWDYEAWDTWLLHRAALQRERLQQHAKEVNDETQSNV